VFVGDSRVDVATARAAGVPFVGVTWGFGSRAELLASGATALADDAGQLAALLA
jgi:phosphoglycolate phosphatase